MLVCSLDVGVVNLAVAFVEVDPSTYRLRHIVKVENVDTRLLEHSAVPLRACTLGHSKTAADRVMHFIQERGQLFDACTHVLIERQPIRGLTDVEQLLFALFRSKAELISPNAMHKLFNMQDFSYDDRKVRTVQVADSLLDRSTFSEYHAMERRHDVADALCLLIYWAFTRHASGMTG